MCEKENRGPVGAREAAQKGERKKKELRSKEKRGCALQKTKKKRGLW
jgi:hypothetical protein